MTPEGIETDFDAGLPGADLVRKGLQDLSQERISVEGLLVLVAGPRLRRLGIAVPTCPNVVRPCEHRLYELLEESYGTDAYSRYNSLLRRMGSYARALEHQREHRE